jgi:rfaE bifunctional protein kinase chain/domain
MTTTPVLLAGDCMLDLYLEGAVERISPEAPVPVLRLQKESRRAGGVANVALNLAALECPCTLATLMGDDGAAASLEALLAKPGLRLHALRAAGFSTTQKIRMVSQRQQLLRMDIETAPADASVHAFTALVRDLMPSHRWLLLSDYAKGALRHSQSLVQHAHGEGLKVLVDPKGRDFSPYAGAWLLKPNRQEAAAVVGEWRDEQDFCTRMQRLRESLGIEHVLVTRGEAGMSLFSGGGRCLHVPTEAREVYDVSGAGDTVLAALACFLARGDTLEDAVRAANRAAGVVVGKFGTATVSLAELGLAESEELHAS